MHRKGMIALTAALAMAGGCHVKHPGSNNATPSPRPSSTTMPTTETAPTGVAESPAPSSSSASQPPVVDSSKPAPTPSPSASASLAGVLPPKKPFIATHALFQTKPDQPSVLLKQHARSDSPVPLEMYDRQPIHAVRDFDLRQTLSANELQRRLGPPVALADYSDPWMVYRLSNGRELWLHFTQPESTRLLYADVISHAEDGYIRRRIFSYDGTQ